MSVSAACAIGALLLRPPAAPAADRPTLIVETTRPVETTGVSRPLNLFAACPALLTQLPPGVRVATEDDRREVRRTPAPGATPASHVTISTFNAPLVDADGRTATVPSSYACPGLCGAGMVLHFEHRGHAWREVESYDPPLWISRRSRPAASNTAEAEEV